MHTHFKTPKFSNSDSTKEAVAQKASNAKTEFQHFLTDIEGLVAQTATLTGEELKQAKEKLQERINEAKQTMDAMSNTIAQRARKGAEITNEYVHQQPWAAVGAGVAIGALLGYAVSRITRSYTDKF
jgi:ElaB/YqjD/DUF883 family membrane-anchored ribosome-binding protein